MKRNSKLSGASARRSGTERPEHRPVEDEVRHAPELDDDDDEQDEEPAAAEDADDHGPDDALGLYLREMGAIPLLNRHDELKLARRLEATREHYRGAALLCPGILQRLHHTFNRIHQGQFHIDPTIEVVASLGLTRERILKRLPL